MSKDPCDVGFLSSLAMEDIELDVCGETPNCPTFPEESFEIWEKLSGILRSVET